MQKAVFLVVLLALIPAAFAGYFDDWYQWLHVPPEYSVMPDLLYFLILPFLAVWAIVWGLLTKIQIFPNTTRINMLLAVLFALACVYYGWIFKVVHTLLSYGSAFAFIVFMVVFVTGTLLFARKKTNVTWKGSALKELKEAERDLEDLRWRRSETKDKDRMAAFDKSIKETEDRITALRTEIERRPESDD